MDIEKYSNDRPLTQVEVAELAARREPEGDDFELDGSSRSCSLTFYGDDGQPEISLRRILDKERRKTVGWELVSSQPFSFGLNVTDVGRAPLPPLVQTQRVYLDGTLSKLFVFNEIRSEPGGPNRKRSQFCDGQNLTFQQLSTLEDFWQLNLKEFHKERRIAPLVPNLGAWSQFRCYSTI